MRWLEGAFDLLREFLQFDEEIWEICESWFCQIYMKFAFAMAT